MRKILIWNMKGGVGKTTTAVNLSFGLAMKKRKTLLISLELQNNISGWFGVPERIKSLYDIHIGNYDDEAFKSCTKKNSMMNQSEFLFMLQKNLYTLKLVSDEKEISEIIKNKVDTSKFTEYIEKICANNDFDYVIVDCPPEITGTHAIMMNLADEIFIPCSMEYSALKGIIQVIKLIELLGSDIKISKVIPTFVDMRNRRKTKEILYMLKSYFKDKLTDDIRMCSKLSECNSFHKDIFSYAPLSTGAEDYNKLILEVLKNEVQDNVRKSV